MMKLKNDIKSNINKEKILNETKNAIE